MLAKQHGFSCSSSGRCDQHRASKIFFQRAEPAGQSDASLRQLLHKMFALVHRGDFEELAEALVREFLIRQLPGDHTDDEAAALEHSICHHTHQSDARAAIHQPDALCRHQSPEGIGLVDVALLPS